MLVYNNGFLMTKLYDCDLNDLEFLVNCIKKSFHLNVYLTRCTYTSWKEMVKDFEKGDIMVSIKKVTKK